ncbi:MAG: PHP domain-containing protein [Myxococcales bacterium]|nr:PHP domain-containing protein [Myxococcales bacterium]
MTRRLSRTLLFASSLLLLGVGCRKPTPGSLLECYRIVTPFEMVGGPGSSAQPGDYVCRNDQIQFVVTQPGHSWGPGLFGGSLIDADLRRSDARYRAGLGEDTFMETFPMANLVIPNSDRMKITIVNDGSDGKETRLRVECDGTFLFNFLTDLLNDPLVQNLVKGIKVNFGMRTDYILRPGARHIVLETTLILPTPTKSGCDALDSCPTLCDTGHKFDPTTGCALCECETPLSMPPLTEPTPVFDRITGDIPGLVGNPGGKNKPGVLAGDFLFFGGQNDVFAPGIGFDEDKEIWDGFFRGVSSLSRPLSFEFVASTSRYVSYGMMVKRETAAPSSCTARVVLSYLAAGDTAAVKTVLLDAGFSEKDADQGLKDLVFGKIPLTLKAGLSGDQVTTTLETFKTQLAKADFRIRTELEGQCANPTVQIPLFTTSATATMSAGLNCSRDSTDDDTCDNKQSFFYRRYFIVGKGDIASVYDEIATIRGDVTGELRGVVVQGSTGQPLSNAQVFALRNPNPLKQWANYEEVVDENTKVYGNAGIVNEFRTDVGTDPVLDGDFGGKLAPGDYLIFARHDGVRSPLYPVTITANSTFRVNLVIPPAGRLQYRISDSEGNRLPAKITLVALDADGNPLYRDGKRIPALGDSRYHDGIRYKFYTLSGEGTEYVEPGRYRAYVSRGFEYSIVVKDLEIGHGDLVTLFTHLQREVKTPGWIAADFHVHHRASFDSEIDPEKRLTTYIAENIEFLSSTDHDILTDYSPTIKKLRAERYLKTIVGVELSTLETGHFLGFPLRFDPLDLPEHGMFDWVGMDAPEVMRALHTHGRYAPEDTIVVVPHPRDGFNGYFDQLGLNPFTLQYKPSGLQANNPCLARSGCEFDAIEIINEKRFELIRNPTVGEVNDYNRALKKIDLATTNGELEACNGKSVSLEVCKEIARLELNTDSVMQMLERTPQEQATFLAFTDNTPEEQTKCDQKSIDGPRLTDDERLKPCTLHEGHLDDWFNLLNYGFNPTAMGNSDSHGTTYEAGFPRNYLRSSSDEPNEIEPREMMRNIKKHKIVATTGPFISFTIDDAEIGETLVPSGATIRLRVKVQTASWIATNRVEIYQNGELIKVLTKDNPKATIVDFDETIDLPKPERDAWFLVIAMGLGRQNVLSPIYLTAPYGLLQIPKLIELTSATFKPLALFVGDPVPVLPDFFPMIPYALTNPIWVDVEGDGFMPLKGTRPPFCPKPCTLPPKEDDGTRPKLQQECPAEMVCVPGIDQTGVCAYDIDGQCVVDPIDSSPETVSMSTLQQGLQQSRVGGRIPEGLTVSPRRRRAELWRRLRSGRQRSIKILRSLIGVKH